MNKIVPVINGINLRGCMFPTFYDINLLVLTHCVEKYGGEPIKYSYFYFLLECLFWVILLGKTSQWHGNEFLH